MPRPASAARVINGDFSAAWDRVVAAVRAVPGLSIEESTPLEGALRARRARVLGADLVTIRLEERETGEVEVQVGVTSGLWGDPAGLARRLTDALEPGRPG